MNNYTYIISSLPIISEDSAKNRDINIGSVLDDIREQLEESDRVVLDFFLKGFDPENLTEDYYRTSSSHKNRFIREYFKMDLNVRNAKAKYLNICCGRPAELDTIRICEDEAEFEQAQVLDTILHGSDILAREKGLDNLMWEHICDLSVFNYFDMDAILAFIAKLKIVDRWLKLDPQRGQEMFRSLVDEVRGTFKGVEF